MPRLNKKRLPLLFAIATAIVALAIGIWYITHHDWHRRTIAVHGVSRRYLWYPPTTRSTELRPLVLAYHGFNGPAERLRRSAKLHDMVDSHGFYLAYIQGDPTWHFFERDELGGNPDVEMFDVLTDQLLADYAIDPDRIYVVGISRGGDFVVHLSLRRSTKVAAMVSQGACLLDEHPAERPVPMMFIVGTRDEEVRPVKVETYPDLYRERGHAVEVLRPEGVPHRWEAPLNEEVWQFLTQYSLNDPAAVPAEEVKVEEVESASDQ
ncbi:alpha/beta hydrolase family esterase [Aeoliella mucimassa]|uniref:Alpha/beta hydrolase family protein n=1 Tax=Aeoliella mucimassa TaxID=2527972 RepID=A0A518AH80_9BACT|nr:PHB depolymerase family esterase [Aeoliella mucimassa]QDU54091.1 Alpha/beta hydrolase family protein [Aeoliella mucimassa]